MHHEKDGRVETYPRLQYHEFEVELNYINRILGLNIDIEKTRECAEKMGLVV